MSGFIVIYFRSKQVWHCGGTRLQIIPILDRLKPLRIAGFVEDSFRGFKQRLGAPNAVTTVLLDDPPFTDECLAKRHVAPFFSHLATQGQCVQTESYPWETRLASARKSIGDAIACQWPHNLTNRCCWFGDHFLSSFRQFSVVVVCASVRKHLSCKLSQVLKATMVLLGV